MRSEGVLLDLLDDRARVGNPDDFPKQGLTGEFTDRAESGQITDVAANPTGNCHRPAVSPRYEFGPETNIPKPVTCVACGEVIPLGRRVMVRVDRDQYDDWCFGCLPSRDAQPARLSAAGAGCP